MPEIYSISFMHPGTIWEPEVDDNGELLYPQEPPYEGICIKSRYHPTLWVPLANLPSFQVIQNGEVNLNNYVSNHFGLNSNFWVFIKVVEPVTDPPRFQIKVQDRDISTQCSLCSTTFTSSVDKLEHFYNKHKQQAQDWWRL